jgi:hypothetical protein
MKKRLSLSKRRVHREVEEKSRSEQKVIEVIQRIATIQGELNKQEMMR